MKIFQILVSGKTFSWGYSFKGRLGHVSKDDCERKINVKVPK